MMGSEERQPTEGDVWSWSSTISGAAGERWTPDTVGKAAQGIAGDVV